MNNIEKWDRRFLELSAHIACWSKDPSTKTGCVIVDQRGRIVSVGYNGLPMGVEDLDERLNNRTIKYEMIVHCERNAIIFAQQSLEGCTIFTTPFISCSPCAGMVIQSGIKRCVSYVNDNPRWKDSFALSQTMFKEAGVELTLYSAPV